MVPIGQFVVDWNWSDNPAGLIREAPVYNGGDPAVLPAISAVVHALADRDGVHLPGWVTEHRATEDMLLFGGRTNSKFGELVKTLAPPTCAYYRVWFEAHLLDKGTPRQWVDR